MRYSALPALCLLQGLLIVAGRHARQQQSSQWETTTAASALVAEEQEESVSPKAPINFLPGLTEVIYPIDPKSQTRDPNLSTSEEEDLPVLQDAESRRRRRQSAGHFIPSFPQLYDSGSLEHARPTHLPIYPGQAQAAFSHRQPGIFSWLDEFSVPRHPQPNAFHPLAFRESKHLASGSGSGSGAGGGGDLTGAGAALLGSGNFGVIRGGTFYPAESEEEDYRFGSGFGANGHGRPSYRANPRPHQHQDFFANFRDFAEINVPALSAYSQLYLVLAAPNRTQQVSSNGRPSNILDQLKALDEDTPSTTRTITLSSKTKLSKRKQKLSKTLSNRKPTSHNEKTNQMEPLLALS